MDKDKLEPKTVSFKLDGEFQEKVMQKLQEVADNQGIKRKEWFEKAFALMEVQELKEMSPEFTTSLNEIENHTTRIYEIVNEMVKQSTNLREHAVHTLEKQLDQQREMTSDYQSRLQVAQQEKEQALIDFDNARILQMELQEQLPKSQEALDTNKLLIQEYKEKNDTLTGLVAKYEAFAEENEQLKQTLASERNAHKDAMDDITAKNKAQEARIAELEQQLTAQKEAHQTTTERLQERLEIEHEKALLQVEREHQKALTTANNEHTAKIQTLYDKLEEQRSAYESKIADLERQLQEKNNKPK